MRRRARNGPGSRPLAPPRPSGWSSASRRRPTSEWRRHNDAGGVRLHPRGQRRHRGHRRVTRPEARHTVNGRLGVRVRAGESIVIGFGLFTDRATQTNIQTFPQFAISYYGGSMGLEFRRQVKLGASERARDLQFMTGIAARYAYGIGQCST